MNINVRGNEPAHVGTLLKALGILGDDIWQHETSYNLFSRSQTSQNLQNYVRNVDPGPHVHSESEPGVDTV